MSYSVSMQGFEGPFDLLLQLVARQKVDIGAVSISDIAGQYLDEVRRMGDLDLEVASDFVLVASTLLYLKAVSLAPADEPVVRDADDELGELSAEELRDVLVARLVTYRTFRGASLALGARAEAEGHMHPRTAGPDPDFAGLMPDYLEGVPLVTLATICANFLARRETFLLESEHIAAKRIPLELRVEQVDRLIRSRGRMTFAELMGDDTSVEGRVVNFLALLELYKRNSVRLTQEELFGAILIDPIEGAKAFLASENAGELSSAGEVARESASPARGSGDADEQGRAPDGEPTGVPARDDAHAHEDEDDAGEGR